jgi:hypothetical protein
MSGNDRVNWPDSPVRTDAFVKRSERDFRKTRLFCLITLQESFRCRANPSKREHRIARHRQFDYSTLESKAELQLAVEHEHAQFHMV